MGRHAAADTRRDDPRERPGRRPRTRRRALLAGGAVAVIGACATAGSTMAAWTDDEAASASFSAGVFVTTGQVNNGTAAQTSASTPGKLTFDAAVTAMLPGSFAYTSFTVGTTSGSVGGKVVSVSSTATADTGAAFTQGVALIPAGTTCSAAAFSAGTPVFADGSSLTQTATTAQSIGAAGASPARYCLKVGLPSTAPNSAQGKSATVTWTFSAQAGS